MSATPGLRELSQGLNDFTFAARKPSYYGQSGRPLGMDDAAEGDLMREEMLDELLRQKTWTRAKRAGVSRPDAGANPVLRF